MLVGNKIYSHHRYPHILSLTEHFLLKILYTMNLLLITNGNRQIISRIKIEYEMLHEFIIIILFYERIVQVEDRGVWNQRYIYIALIHISLLSNVVEVRLKRSRATVTDVPATRDIVALSHAGDHRRCSVCRAGAPQCPFHKCEMMLRLAIS